LLIRALTSTSQHILDGAHQIAIDADHLAARRQIERGALRRRDRAALQDDAAGRKSSLLWPAFISAKRNVRICCLEITLSSFAYA